MAKKVFTDESLATLISEIKAYTDSATSTKADDDHKHSASDITSGTLSSDRLSTVPVTKGGTGATTAAGALTNLGLTATAAELNKMDGVTVSTTEINTLSGIDSNIQAQLDARINQNAFSNIKIGTTIVEADTTTDTVEFAGNNVTITPDATNDKVTFSVADGSTSKKGIVQLTDSTSSASTTTAATPKSVKSAYDLAYTARDAANTVDNRLSEIVEAWDAIIGEMYDKDIPEEEGITNLMSIRDIAASESEKVKNSLQPQIDGKASSATTVNDKPLSSNITLSASDVGADASGTASSKVSSHDTSTTAHNDIRLSISELTTRLNALADSDDTTLDQLSEIVAYIKSNKSLIDNITTNKVNVDDIINNLTTNVTNKPLSAAQGVALKGLIDALQAAVDGKADSVHGHAISDIAELRTELDSKAAAGHTHIYYGVCSTAAGTAAKTVTVPNFVLETGAMVVVKFSNSNSASSPTLNVSGTGAKTIYRYGTTKVSTATTTTGWIAGAVQLFVYDGNGWVRDYWSNTTYTNAGLGSGYAICDTAASTSAKEATLSDYVLKTGGFVSVKFKNKVPAQATLNINSAGAKEILHKGYPIEPNIINAGDVATFVYSEYYHLISIDRDSYPKDQTYSSTQIDNKLADMAIMDVDDNASIEMTATINKGWLKDTSDIKFAPKTLIEQVQDNDGKLLSVYLDELNTVEVSSVQPTNETTQLWINPGVQDIKSVPEIKDDVINNDDTWSSAKINSMLSGKAKAAPVDFTSMTLEQIVQFVTTQDGMTCTGRFKLSPTHSPNGAVSWYRGMIAAQNPIGNGNSVDINIIAMRDGNTWQGNLYGTDTYTLEWNKLVREKEMIKTVDVSVTLKNLTWTKSNDGMCYAAINSNTYGSKVISATICGWGSLATTYTILPYITTPNKVSLMCPTNSFGQYSSVTVRIVYVD